MFVYTYFCSNIDTSSSLEMLTSQQQERTDDAPPRDEMRDMIENDPKTKELALKHAAIDNYRHLIQDILLAIQMLDLLITPGSSTEGSPTIDQVLEHLRSSFLFIYNTPQIYTETQRTFASDAYKWLGEWLAGAAEPPIDPKTGDAGSAIVLIVDFLFRVDKFYHDIKDWDLEDSKNMSLAATIHYDPLAPYLELCDTLGLQARRLRDHYSDTEREETVKTVVQLLKPAMFVVHPVNSQFASDTRWVLMRNNSDQIVTTLIKCLDLLSSMKIEYDEQKAKDLSDASMQLVVLAKPPLQGVIGGKTSSSSSGIGERLQEIYDLTRSAHDLMARRVPKEADAKYTIHKCLDACNDISVDFKLETTMFSIMKRSLIVSLESKDQVECVMALRLALREILQLARYHSIDIMVPITDRPVKANENDDENQSGGEEEAYDVSAANNDVVCQINDLVHDLGESTIDGESDERVLSDDLYRRIKQTLKYAKSVNIEDDDRVSMIKQIKTMLKEQRDSETIVTDIGDALTQLSLDLAPQ